MERVWETLQIALGDWNMMQHTGGDEGAELAERFERHFYLFIDEFELWFQQLSPKPQEVEEAEEQHNIKKVIEYLPEPLYITFFNELIRIVDEESYSQYD